MPARPSKTVVIITALEVETRAVLRQLGKSTVETIDGTGFFKGQFAGWDIAVVEAGAGNSGAAAIAVRALTYFKPEHAFFVGVAGGVKDVVIGDVVVGTKVYAYESGKDTAMGFRPRPDAQNTAHELEQRARIIRQQDEWKKRLDPVLKHETPVVYVAPIAAGEKVVASTKSATAKLIKATYGDTLAVEMEGSGFLEGVHISHPTKGVVIRGISDLLSKKGAADKAGSQQRAADAASAVAFEILAALDGGAGTTQTTKPTFIETPTTFCGAAYFRHGEILARVGVPGVDEVAFAITHWPDGYMRIIPMERRDQPIPISKLNACVDQAELIRNTGYGGISTVNRFGAIFYGPAGTYPIGMAPLHWATQLFQNGEVWSFTDTMIVRERGWRPSSCPIPLIPATILEQSFYRAFHKNVRLAADHLGLTFPCYVELGLRGIYGAYLAVNNDDVRGPIQFGEAMVRVELQSSDAAAIDAVLLEFYTEVFDKTGYARPEGLHNFPPTKAKAGV